MDYLWKTIFIWYNIFMEKQQGVQDKLKRCGGEAEERDAQRRAKKIAFLILISQFRRLALRL